MGFLETFDGRTQSLNGKFAQLRILFRARGFVGRQLGEAGDATGLFIVRFSKTPTSDLSVPSSCSNSRLRSSLMESAAADARLNFVIVFRSWFPPRHYSLPPIRQVCEKPAVSRSRFIIATLISREGSMIKRLPKIPTIARCAAGWAGQVPRFLNRQPQPAPSRPPRGCDRVQRRRRPGSLWRHAQKKLRSPSSSRSRAKGRVAWRERRRSALTSGGTCQKQGQIGPCVADGKSITFLTRASFQPASITLICRGRIVKAVAEDNFTGGQGGADDFADEFERGWRSSAAIRLPASWPRCFCCA